jgi:phage tail-like protein
MEGFYPPVNFHFKVEFEDFGRATDTYFQSVSGLDVSINMTTWREAGANGYVHYVPQQVQYTDLVLKRGVFRPKESDITDWFNQAIRDFHFSPRNILVSLLDEKHEPLMVWKVFHALPKSWKMQDMNAEQGSVFIETMTLAYSYFTFSKG